MAYSRCAGSSSRAALRWPPFAEFLLTPPLGRLWLSLLGICRRAADGCEALQARRHSNACSVIPGRAGPIIAWMADKELLPEAYFYGTAFVLAHLKRVAFLNGEYAISGWRHYFPYCFAVKTPLALFAVCSWRVSVGACLATSRQDSVFRHQQNVRRIGDLVPVAVLLCVYWAFRDPFDIQYRLSTYPAGLSRTLYRLRRGGKLVSASQRSAIRPALRVLSDLFVTDSLSAYPNYSPISIRSFREPQAYQHLVDSNLDWGQDLPGLAAWLRSTTPATPSCLFIWATLEMADRGCMGSRPRCCRRRRHRSRSAF